MPMKRYDYETVLASLKERVSKKLNGENLLFFSTNSALLEAVAEEIDDLALYNEFLTREAIWSTAKGYSSIMKQASFFNYRPHRMIGAKGYVHFSTMKNFTLLNQNIGHFSPIKLPKWTKVKGTNINFVISEDGVLSANQSFITLPVIQGEKITRTIIVNQSDYFQIDIIDSNIENSMYEVYVNNQLWEELPNLRQSVLKPDPRKAHVYSLQTLPRYTGVTLYFGNNDFGKALNKGDVVEFNYLRTLGDKGNIFSSNILNSVDSVLYDEQYNQVEVYCYNSDALLGGKNNEQLADIKIYAPQTMQTINRAITCKDYITIIQQENKDIKGIQVWGEKEINEDRGNPPGTYLEAFENVVYITGYTIDPNTNLGKMFSEADQARIRKTLNEKKGTTDILQFVDTEIVYVTFNAIIYISDLNYSSEQVLDYVQKSLYQNFSIEKGQYKKNLYFSDYIAAIDNTTGVDHCICSIVLSRLTSFKVAFEFDLNLNIQNIKQGTIELKIKNDLIWGDGNWKLIAVDQAIGDGKGEFVGILIDDSEICYQFPNTLIDYQNGLIGKVIILGLPEDSNFSFYQIRVDFQLDDSEGGNLKLLKRNQLFAWYSNNLESELMLE